MSIKKRLRILWAAMTQNWQTVTCRCGKAVWISDGAGHLLDGQLCDECEGVRFAQWAAKQQAGHGRKGAA